MTISSIGVQSQDISIVSDCLWALSYSAEQDKDDSIIRMIYDSAVIPFVMDYLTTKEYKVFIPALRTIGNIAACDSPDIIAYILRLGIVDKLN